MSGSKAFCERHYWAFFVDIGCEYCYAEYLESTSFDEHAMMYDAPCNADAGPMPAPPPEAADDDQMYMFPGLDYIK